MPFEYINATGTHQLVLPSGSRWQIIGYPVYDSAKERTNLACRCACGTERIVWIRSLADGTSLSCGCLSKEVTGVRSRTHGRSGTKEYAIWRGIKDRCLNPSNHAYRYYGGRGITVCDRWRNSFENFLADVGLKPPGMSLDRWPNNDGNYEPGNVRWATRKQQANNTSANRLLEMNGRTMNLSAWAEETGISQYNISQRIIRLRWSTERALTTPERKITTHGNERH